MPMVLIGKVVNREDAADIRGLRIHTGTCLCASRGTDNSLVSSNSRTQLPHWRNKPPVFIFPRVDVAEKAA